MVEDLIRYDRLVETALRDVVRKTLVEVAKNGLPGEHHFYISFLTKDAGVEVPDYLQKQYPDEMTIVLQYQFYSLKIEGDHFTVSLSFNNVREKLRIPFAAITTFADPSVNFALQFQNMVGAGDRADDESEEEDAAAETAEDKKPKKEEKRGEVISLDQFRQNNKKPN